jgi:hypothetical protein
VGSAATRRRRRERRTTPDLLFAFVEHRAQGATPPRVHHWVHGTNEIVELGLTEFDGFCPSCCVEKVSEIFSTHPERAEFVGICMDGGWGVEADGPVWCTTCRARLRVNLTDAGFESALSELMEYGVDFEDLESWAMLRDALGHVRAGKDSVYGAHPRPNDELSAAIETQRVWAWRVVAKIVRKARVRQRLAGGTA